MEIPESLKRLDKLLSLPWGHNNANNTYVYKLCFLGLQKNVTGGDAEICIPVYGGEEEPPRIFSISCYLMRMT